MLLSTLACSWCWLLPVVTAQAASSSISSLRRSSRRSAAIENQYFVLLKTHKPSRSLEHLLQRRRLSHDTSIKEGLLRTVQNLQEEDLVILLNHDEVAFVEQDQYISLASSESSSLSWGLDRLDQEHKNLDHSFHSSFTGQGVEIFVLDSGIHHTHQEFRTGGITCGFNALPNGAMDDCSDSTGHGTHVSSIIAGQTMGVAPDSSLNIIKVVNATGFGPLSSTIRGIQYVIEKQSLANRTGVLNISLGSVQSDALTYALNLAVQYGVVVVVAAGNDGGSACRWSAGRARNAITVGATTQRDRISKFSNYGSCVDLFAPGSDIPGANFVSNTAYDTVSGTSQAAPFVAGVAALYLERWPTLTPAQVATRIKQDATRGEIHTNFFQFLSGTPNLLLTTKKLS